MTPTQIMEIQDELRDLQRAVCVTLVSHLQRPNALTKGRLASAIDKQTTFIKVVLTPERSPGFPTGHTYSRKSIPQSESEESENAA